MAGASGLSNNTAGIAGPILTYLAAGGTAPALVTPFKVAFLSQVRTANNTTSGSGAGDLEWATGTGYTQTAGGATGGVAAPSFAAPTALGPSGSAQVISSTAVTLNSAPANLQWAGNRIQDGTAGTNKELWYAALATPKTVNTGDTCTIPINQLTLNLG
jgi:hypothetical protein